MGTYYRCKSKGGIMKLESNMYVRMASGRIAKIDSIEKDTIEFDDWVINTYGDHLDSFVVESQYLKQITKASHNIVDLIELGDYVNGEMVLDITGEYLYIGNEAHNKFWLSNNIKTILTHEQFENNCYKVGD